MDNLEIYKKDLIVLVESIKLAQKRGAFDLDEVDKILPSIKNVILFTNEKLKPQPEEENGN